MRPEPWLWTMEWEYPFGSGWDGHVRVPSDAIVPVGMNALPIWRRARRHGKDGVLDFESLPQLAVKCGMKNGYEQS